MRGQEHGRTSQPIGHTVILLDSITPVHPKLSYPRTFGNSHVRQYSWPCILVLVREWIPETEFGKQGGPSPWDIVPKRLFLPDGRVVPACTVLAPPTAQVDTRPRPPLARPNEGFGGGLPVYVNIQHEDHVATVGCLVSDSHTAYALTTRHVCGEPGTEVSVLLRGGLSPIGRSSEHQIARRVFADVYPALPLRQTWLNLDIGLVRVDDRRAWTPNTYGLPPIKPLFDIYEQNLSLRRLMDQPVVGAPRSSSIAPSEARSRSARASATSASCSTSSSSSKARTVSPAPEEPSGTTPSARSPSTR